MVIGKKALEREAFDALILPVAAMNAFAVHRALRALMDPEGDLSGADFALYGFIVLGALPLAGPCWFSRYHTRQAA